MVLDGLLQVSLALQSLAPRTKATKLTLTYNFQGGNKMGAPASATVGQIGTPTVVESNSTNPSIPPVGPLAYASDTMSVATVDPVSGFVTPVAAGLANISVLDTGNGLSDSVPVTVSGGVGPGGATSLTLSYSFGASSKRR